MNVLNKRSFTMTKRKRTNKSKYKHQSTGEYCTCAAYVAEIMCMRNAEHKNKGSLPYKFWNKKPWDWTFKKQLIAANKILKDVSEKALVKAIHSPEFKSIFSLNNRRVKTIIKKYALLADEEKETNQKIDYKKDPTRRSKTFGKKSKLDRLRSIELDAEKKDYEDNE